MADAPAAGVAPAPSGTRNPYVPYRQLIPATRIRELSRLRPARAVLDTVRCWALILAAWTLVAIHPEWWTVAIAFVLVGTQFYALFILAHDGMHRRLLRKRAANDLFCDLFLLGPIGAITRINNRNHLLHHRHLASAEDPDRHRHCCANKGTRPRFASFLTGLANIVPAASNVFLRRRDADAGPRAHTREYTLRDVAIIVGWQAVLIAGLTIAIGWWAYPLLWLAPVYVHTYLGDLVRSFLEHSHPESDEAADEHRLISYTSSPLEKTFFAPMNMNNHTAHHLWPSVPYYNLPALDAELRASDGIEGLTWRRSYVGYLLSYFFALPLAECRPDRAPRAT